MTFARNYCTPVYSGTASRTQILSDDLFALRNTLPDVDDFDKNTCITMASITAVRVDRKLHRALKIPMLKFKTFKLTKNSHAAVKKIETEFSLPTSQLDINLINFKKADEIVVYQLR